MSANLYDIEVKTITGSPVKLSEYAGKVLLIVNVASECGFTPQYGPLQELYDSYKDRGLVVLGFPANNFGAQEPGSNEEIQTFCESKFGVTFPMFEKISVSGADQHPLYAALTSAKGEVKWNFAKFLINSKGEIVEHFPSKVAPTSPELRTAIEALLP